MSAEVFFFFFLHLGNFCCCFVLKRKEKHLDKWKMTCGFWIGNNFLFEKKNVLPCAGHRTSSPPFSIKVPKSAKFLHVFVCLNLMSCPFRLFLLHFFSSFSSSSSLPLPFLFIFSSSSSSLPLHLPLPLLFSSLLFFYSTLLYSSLPLLFLFSSSSLFFSSSSLPLLFLFSSSTHPLSLTSHVSQP